MPALSRHHPVASTLGACSAALLVLPVCPALAQTGGSIGLVSENSLRGLSLSDGHPALQLRVEHEGAAGWFAGAFASTVKRSGSYGHGQLVAYAGYARRTTGGLAWEAGASMTAFPGQHRFDYLETYAGVSLERGGVRLYLSPSYYGAGRTAYLELSAHYPLDEHLRLIAQAGLLRRLESGAAARQRTDFRLGIGADVGDCTLQLAWLARQHDPGLRARRARALAASASYAF